VINSDQRLKLVRFFLLWKVDNGGALDYVHLYDGVRFVTHDYANQNQTGQDGNLRHQGDHTQIDKLSTFELRDPVTCGVGFGISFNINAFYTTGPVSPDVAFTVTAAGGDYIPV